MTMSGEWMWSNWADFDPFYSQKLAHMKGMVALATQNRFAFPPEVAAWASYSQCDQSEATIAVNIIVSTALN